MLSTDVVRVARDIRMGGGEAGARICLPLLSDVAPDPVVNATAIAILAVVELLIVRCLGVVE